MRRRDDEDLALDRVDGVANHARGDVALPSTHAGADVGNDPPPRSVDELRAELAQLRERIARSPDALVVDHVHASRDARVEAERIVDEASARITELERRTRGPFRNRTVDPTALAFERERLKAAQQQRAKAMAREQELAADAPDRATRRPEHAALRERAAVLEGKLSILRQQHLRGALQHSAPYLTATLGPFPEQPRARRTWQQAARRIEAYRFDHAITDPDNALGPPPATSSARAHWQRIAQDVHRAQRELGHNVDRGHRYER